MTRMAQSNTAHVAEFCRQISVDYAPVIVPIRPDENCEPLECFNNVRRKVEREGGSIRFGWAIWEWPNVYLEAEHHAVYELQSGTYIDLTPSLETETHRLFLRDDSATYDFNNQGMRIDNRRHALANDFLVQQFFQTASRINKEMNKIPGVGAVKTDLSTALRLQALEEEKLRLVYEIGRKYTSRNARCFCGSGLKFKHCHA